MFSRSSDRGADSVRNRRMISPLTYDRTNSNYLTTLDKV